MGYSRMTNKENRSPSQGPEQKRRSVAVIYHFFPHYRKAVVEALARSDPGLSNKLLVNLGRHLSARLRQTTDTLRELVDSRG